MDVPSGFYDMICTDIKRIETLNSESVNELLALHRELDGHYQACIKDWYAGLWGANGGYTAIHYSALEDAPDTLRDNLRMMKAKLETFRFQMNAVQTPDSSDTTITVNNTNVVNFSISFDEARQKIEDMTALSREQTDEILEKIDELEKISKENSPRKTKWEKVKPIISFALDKGADVAIAILTLVVQMKLGI